MTRPAAAMDLIAAREWVEGIDTTVPAPSTFSPTIDKQRVKAFRANDAKQTVLRLIAEEERRVREG